MAVEDYWITREKEHIKQSIKDDKVLLRKISDTYDRAMNEITKEIDAFYSNYATKEGISMSDAVKRVKAADTEAFSLKAKELVRLKDFSEEANEKLRLYNLTMKVNRLEMLKANIGLELTSMSNDELFSMRTALEQQVYDELERQAGILGQSVIKNPKLVETLVNASFQNATFSERIWSNHDALKSELDKLLSRGMIQGKNPRVLAKEIQKTFKASKYDAERLMITELARAQTAAQKVAFDEYGYDEVEWIAEPDACDVCKPRDGKVYKVSDIGTKIMIPAHPFCRCSFAAHMSREEREELA